MKTCQCVLRSVLFTGFCLSWWWNIRFFMSGFNGGFSLVRRFWLDARLIVDTKLSKFRPPQGKNVFSFYSVLKPCLLNSINRCLVVERRKWHNFWRHLISEVTVVSNGFWSIRFIHTSIGNLREKRRTFKGWWCPIQITQILRIRSTYVPSHKVFSAHLGIPKAFCRTPPLTKLNFCIPLPVNWKILPNSFTPTTSYCQQMVTSDTAQVHEGKDQLIGAV